MLISLKNFNEQEIITLRQLLEISIRAEGSRVAGAVLFFLGKIDTAVKEASIPSVEVPPTNVSQ